MLAKEPDLGEAAPVAMGVMLEKNRLINTSRNIAGNGSRCPSARKVK